VNISVKKSFFKKLFGFKDEKTEVNIPILPVVLAGDKEKPLSDLYFRTYLNGKKKDYLDKPR
jgi:hypothetical protein